LKNKVCVFRPTDLGKCGQIACQVKKEESGSVYIFYDKQGKTVTQPIHLMIAVNRDLRVNIGFIACVIVTLPYARTLRAENNMIYEKKM
jgi:hypothetical protein